MFPFSKPKGTILIKPDSLEFKLEVNAPIVLSFPPEVVSNQEIVDETKYESMVNQFLIDNKIKDYLFKINLSPQVIFQKTITEKNPIQQEALINNFLSKVPFENKNISKSEEKSVNGVTIKVTNRMLFEKLITVLKKNGIEVVK